MFPIQRLINPRIRTDRRAAEPGPPPDAPEAILVASERQWEALRAHLLRPDGLEYVAYAVLGQGAEDAPPRYYVHRVACVPAEGMRRQGPGIAEPTTETVLDAFRLYAESRGAAFMHAHSHPFCAHAEFSAVDDACLPPTRHDLFRYVDRRPPARPHRYVRLVTGQAPDGFSADAFGVSHGALHRIGEVRVVGPSGIRRLRAARAGASGQGGLGDPTPDETLDRNIRWLGAEGQARIARAHVAVAGAGGAGVEVLRALRGLGVRRYTLVDPDRVEASNLNRLPWRAEDVGRPKVEVAAAFLRGVDAAVSVETHCEAVSHPGARRALLDADLIVSAVDDDEARLELQILAARHVTPLLEVGAGIIPGKDGQRVRRMGGHFRFYVPGGPCLLCMGLDPASVNSRATRAIHRAAGYIRGTDETPGSVVTINAMLGGLAGDAAMRFLSGFSVPPSYVDFDLLTMRLRTLEFDRRPDCSVCGDAGVEGLGEERVVPFAPSAAAAARHEGSRPPRQRRTAPPADWADPAVGADPAPVVGTAPPMPDGSPTAAGGDGAPTRPAG